MAEAIFGDSIPQFMMCTISARSSTDAVSAFSKSGPKRGPIDPPHQCSAFSRIGGLASQISFARFALSAASSGWRVISTRTLEMT